MYLNVYLKKLNVFKGFRSFGTLGQIESDFLTTPLKKKKISLKGVREKKVYLNHS